MNTSNWGCSPVFSEEYYKSLVRGYDTTRDYNVAITQYRKHIQQIIAMDTKTGSISPKRRDEIFSGILAALRITDINLISLSRRLAKRSEEILSRRVRNSECLPKRNHIILQTEANSLFKGNFVRVLKSIYGSREVNFIKSYLTVVLTMSEDDGYVQWLRCHWDLYKREYFPYQIIADEISSAFNKLTTEDYSYARQEAINEVSVPYESAIVPEKISDINLNSIKNIKFTTS